MADHKATVYVIDDDPAVRSSMQALLTSVALDALFFDKAEHFLETWKPTMCGCLLVDLRMPGMGGLDLQEALAKHERQPPIIFLTGYPSTGAAVRAMRGGAVDFLTKPVDDDSLIERLHTALEQDQRRLRQWHTQCDVQERLDSLTPREMEVLRGVAAGLSNKLIARELDISYKTVELHRGHMMEKMRADSIAEVVGLYLSVHSEPDEVDSSASDALTSGGAVEAPARSSRAE